MSRIEVVRLYRVAMPLVTPWGSDVGRESSIESVLLNLVTTDHSVWSEVTPHAAPIYTPEWAGGVVSCLRDFLVPELFRCPSLEPAAVGTRLQKFKGNDYAHGAIDIALWLLKAKTCDQSLAQVVGVNKDSTRVGEALGREASIDHLLKKIQAAIDQGYARVKLKYGPGWDFAMLSAVRGTYPHFPLHIDCNGAYDESEIANLAKLDQFNLLMIEQPFAADDLLSHVGLAKVAQTPICIDESVTSLDVVRTAVTLGACQWVHLKPGRIGGLSAVKKIHDFCVSENVACAIGSDLSSAIGEQIVVAASLLPGVKLATAAFPSGRLYPQELATEPLQFHRDSEGFLVVRVDGFREPNDEILQKWCVEKIELRPS